MLTVAPLGFTRFMTPWMLLCRKLSLLLFIVRRKMPTVIGRSFAAFQMLLVV